MFNIWDAEFTIKNTSLLELNTRIKEVKEKITTVLKVDNFNITSVEEKNTKNGGNKLLLDIRFIVPEKRKGTF